MIEPDFFFHEWALLAQLDPDAFERRRHDTIHHFLNSSGRQKSLGICLQREIDAERGRADDAQIAFQVILTMLCRQLAFLGEELTNLRNDLKKINCATHSA